MTRCIVHIGMHRTGSTSIQHSLHGFRNDQFAYARLGDDPNHSLAIHSLFAPEPERHHLHRRNGANPASVSDYITKMRDELQQAVSDSEGRTLIISGEDISSLPRDGLVKLRDHFQKCFDDVAVVGYVRAPAGLMTSVFQHQVRLGAVDHFDLDRQYRSYKGTFGRFDEVFGRERVNLWKFDIGSFPDGCVVRDFCARLGIALTPEHIVRLNESLPRQVVALLYTYHKLGPTDVTRMTGPDTQNLLDYLAVMGNDLFRLSPEVIRPILEKNRADGAWMEARLGQTLHEDLGEHLPGDVRDESDLLRLDPTVIGKLLVLLGDATPTGVKGETSEQVARLIHALRQTRTEQGKSPRWINNYFGKKIVAIVQYLLR